MEFQSHEWRPLRDPQRRRAPGGLAAWLAAQGSLTQRLSRFCGAPVRVEVLHERWERPRRDEARLLRLPAHQHVWVREVLLHCAGIARVYARTIMPRDSLQGGQRRLRRLGTTPLGMVVFGRSPVHRTPLRFRLLGPQHRLHQDIQRRIGSVEPLWARRSILHYRGRGLLVAEVFLPGLVDSLVRETKTCLPEGER